MDQDTIVEKEEKDENEEDEKTIIEETPPEEQKSKSADNAAESVLEIMMMFLEGEVGWNILILSAQMIYETPWNSYYFYLNFVELKASA